MKQITSKQHNDIAEQFAELVVDGMDMKTLVQYVYDDLIAVSYTHLTLPTIYSV